MKTALVVDWLDKFAGAERVIASINKNNKIDEHHALINIMSTNDIIKTFGNIITIKSTWLSIFGKHFRYLLPLFPFFIRNLKVSSDITLVISSSHCIAKAVKAPKGAFHICYFQARNSKYIWEEYDIYFRSWKRAFMPLIPLLRYLDKKSASNPDCIIANSKFVKKWIFDIYGIEADVIYPPIDLARFSMGSHKKDYFITVGRLEPYKKFDIIIEAFNKSGLNLVIVGDGSERKKLELMAHKNITFTGFLETTEINKLLGDARAFVYAGIEDFGIAPLEAQATGCPVICLGLGGTAETVIHLQTGIHFLEQTSKSLNDAIELFLMTESSFNYFDIFRHSRAFSEEAFADNFKKALEEKLYKNNNILSSELTKHDI
jgi:glycosyltransferase involved in cell wall biosynthesis